MNSNTKLCFYLYYLQFRKDRIFLSSEISQSFYFWTASGADAMHCVLQAIDDKFWDISNRFSLLWSSLGDRDQPIVLYPSSGRRMHPSDRKQSEWDTDIHKFTSWVDNLCEILSDFNINYAGIAHIEIRNRGIPLQRLKTMQNSI